MARYCSWCGEPLEPGARYCPECGARVLESVKVDGSGDSDPMRGFDIVRGNPIPAEKTSKLDRDALAAIELNDDLPENTQGSSGAISAKSEARCDESSGEVSNGKTPGIDAADDPSVSGDFENHVGEIRDGEGKPAEDVPADDFEAAPVIPREEQEPARKAGPMAFDGTDTLVLPSDVEPKHFGLDRPDLAARRRRRILVALCCVIALLLVAACALAYCRFGTANTANQGAQEETQSAQQDEQKQSDQASQKDDSQQSPAESDLAKEEPTPTDEQIFQTLSSAYDALDSYSDRIVDCVDDFNGLFLARSLDERNAAKEVADKVKSDLEAELAEINDLKVAQSSVYASDVANLAELYECQIGRIASITDAWEVSVQYEIPSQHKEEILSALSANYVDGNNAYLERYDELYPYAKPVER